MPQQLINRSPDLKALRDDGYEIAIKSGYLIIYNVPYVDSKKQVKRGALVSELSLSGDKTTTPSTHVAMFVGEHPCDRYGQKLKRIEHQSTRKKICDGLVVDYSFSSKPIGGIGYKNYYDKMTTYAGIITAYAKAIDLNATARTYAIIESDDPDAVFNYIDTASSRAGISAVSKKLVLTKVGIIGLGGTGSYILDLVAKTPVREIHLFDGDDFLQHNAFRSPGAPSIDELKERPKKVHYLAQRYASMRKHIFAHDSHIDASNIDLLAGMDFVFLCVDAGNVKQTIIEKLVKDGTPFIDVGMGIELVDEQLLGILRVTTCTPDMRDHIKDRISFSDADADGVYAHNIQTADLNALNAALAVIKWKKLFGFYLDLDNEHSSNYTLDGNIIINTDKT